MVSIDQHQENIITIIKESSTRNIILQDQNIIKPSYPFITYKFINKYQNEPGMPELNSELVDKDGVEYYRYKYKQYYTTVLSLTVYSDEEIEANNIAEELYDFLTFLGLEKFKKDNIVISEVGNIDNRDTLLVDDYERRFGFDVTFRLVKELDKDVETINTVEL